MIEFESVSKTYRDGTAAVADLSLTVPSDKITVFVGPSGCGKTTTLRMVNRMLEPTKGRITWDGVPLKSKRKTTLRRQMGYVIQSGGLFPHRTVLDNIGTVPGLLGWSKAKIRARSLELLSSVGLDRKLALRYPAQLSGGQQQRVGVARALAADPMVMLMDEPFSAVDPVVRGELHEFFLGLQRQLSKTIILITHDIDEAIKLGDQVAILRVGGRLAQVGTPQELLDEPADAFVEGFVGKDRGYRSLSFLPAAGLPLTGLKVVRSVDAAVGGESTLVVDESARPIGWADPSRSGRVFPLGATFVPETDTMRLALDSALTSPHGLAVAVAPGTGRFAGVVDAATILGQVSRARAQQLDSITISEAEELVAERTPDQQPATAVAPVDGPAGDGAADEVPATAEPTEETAPAAEALAPGADPTQEDTLVAARPEVDEAPADAIGTPEDTREESADTDDARGDPDSAPGDADQPPDNGRPSPSTPDEELTPAPGGEEPASDDGSAAPGGPASEDTLVVDRSAGLPIGVPAPPVDQPAPEPEADEPTIVVPRAPTADRPADDPDEDTR